MKHIILLNPIYDRPSKNYRISLILENKEYQDEDEEDHFWWVKNSIFSTLNISELDWNDKIEWKNMLKNFEKYYDINNDQITNEEFASFFVNDSNIESFTDLEQDIKHHVGNHFSFDPVLSSMNQEQKNIVCSEILQLYNFLINAKIMQKNNLLRLIYYFTNVDDEGGTGVTNMKKIDIYPMIAIYLKKDWFKNRFDVYARGIVGTKSSMSSFVHEFGHAIHGFFSLDPLSKQNLNLGFDFVANRYQNFDDHFIKHFENRFNREPNDIEVKATSEIIKKYFYYKFNDIEYDENLHSQELDWEFANFYFCSLTAVPSDYGRKDAFDDGMMSSSDLAAEWFAEGFAYYYLTPIEQRNKIWQWWHEFFTKIAPNKFS